MDTESVSGAGVLCQTGKASQHNTKPLSMGKLRCHDQNGLYPKEGWEVTGSNLLTAWLAWPKLSQSLHGGGGAGEGGYL